MMLSCVFRCSPPLRHQGPSASFPLAGWDARLSKAMFAHWVDCCMQYVLSATCRIVDWTVSAPRMDGSLGMGVGCRMTLLDRLFQSMTISQPLLVPVPFPCRRPCFWKGWMPPSRHKTRHPIQAFCQGEGRSAATGHVWLFLSLSFLIWGVFRPPPGCPRGSGHPLADVRSSRSIPFGSPGRNPPWMPWEVCATGESTLGLSRRAIGMIGQPRPELGFHAWIPHPRRVTEIVLPWWVRGRGEGWRGIFGVKCDCGWSPAVQARRLTTWLSREGACHSEDSPRESSGEEGSRGRKRDLAGEKGPRGSGLWAKTTEYKNRETAV
ncbi:hypothetical protein B0T18DRAFT_400979 [Schizothecium vesticola]|uniref:Uncharacterized protein n=1 Tax=Schizothecium vesticola TaxID=314040 RepID=A0AA40F4C5_9PEZI|nr:hypothetical protein B0T18DRAFT_400979 [Schizothecium vesticola]